MSDFSEQIQRQVEEAQQRAAAARAFAERTESLTASGHSPRGEVEVAVDRAGRLVNIVFSSRALEEVSADALRTQVLQATAKAQARVHAAAIGLAEDAFGRDSATTAMFREQFPGPSLGGGSDGDEFKGDSRSGLLG